MVINTLILNEWCKFKRVMQTKILTNAELGDAVALLAAGEVVAVPTETVYGLAADATNEHAIQKIFTSKGRPSDHPLIVHLDSFESVIDWAQDIPETAKILADKFWPGPLTMILRKRSHVSDLITGGLETVAVRVPNHPLTLEIIRRLKRAVVAPSANAHKRTSPTMPEHVLKTLNGKIAAVVDGQQCGVGIESTIIDMTKQSPVILRPGAITAAMIQAVLHQPIETPALHQEKVSGNMKVHYQPDTPLLLMPIDTIKARLASEKNVAVLHYSDLEACDEVAQYTLLPDPVTYQKTLYHLLHTIDASQVEKLYVETPPTSHEWDGINDRLRKACANDFEVEMSR